MRSSRDITQGGSSSSTAKPASVSVVVRARPPLRHEAPYGHCARTEGRKVILTTSAPEGNCERQRRQQQQQPHRTKAIECDYDQVLGMTATQDDVWQAVSSTIDKAMEGYNVTLFTYGMTGSGKTFTMLGPKLMEAAFEGEVGPNSSDLHDCPQRGLVPRVMQRIFEQLGSSQSKDESSSHKPGVTLSYVQIYQERCYDLLRPAETARPLRVREDARSNGNVYIEDLSELPVTSAEDCYEKLIYGFSNVAFRSTTYNEQSSRAHCVLTLTVRQRVGLAIRESKVRLVDLAGNERWDTLGPEMSQQHARELTAINKSLHVLGNCIQVLSHAPPVSKRDGQPIAQHVPYRDSVLTMILRDSLSGNSFTLMVCTICSSSVYQVQTLCTLRFADRAKRVKMKAKVCDVLDPQAQLQQTQAELEYLRALVANGGDSSGPAAEELRERLSRLELEYCSLEGENKHLKRQLADLERQQQEHQVASAAKSASDAHQKLQPLRRACSAPSLLGPDLLADLDADCCGDRGRNDRGGESLGAMGSKTWGAVSLKRRGRSVHTLRFAEEVCCVHTEMVLDTVVQGKGTVERTAKNQLRLHTEMDGIRVLTKDRSTKNVFAAMMQQADFHFQKIVRQKVAEAGDDLRGAYQKIESITAEIEVHKGLPPEGACI